MDDDNRSDDLDRENMRYDPESDMPDHDDGYGEDAYNMNMGPPGTQPMPPGSGPGPNFMMRPMMGGPMMPLPPGFNPQDGPPGMGMMPPMGMPPPPPHPNWNEDDYGDQDDSEPPGVSHPRISDSSKLPSLLTLKVSKPEELKERKQNQGAFVLPRALEEALAFKDQRASEVGRSDNADRELPHAPPAPVISSDYGGDFADSDEETAPEPPRPPVISQDGANRVAKNRQRKKRRKAAKANKAKGKENEEKAEAEEGEKVEALVEYVQESIKFHELEPMYRQFHRIFEAFKISDQKEDIKDIELGANAPKFAKQPEKVQDQFEPEEEVEEKRATDEAERMSKRKLKKLSRLSVAELKQLVSRPDVVEMYDVTARDPKLLVQLKAHRNTVQVPRHWCYKRKYLQGKRGIEKPAFDLPDFIKKTGIMEMRASLQDKEETKSLKAKMRERARPKLGKIDIDYQKLHDAFFKWQTKPRMTIHGDLYYEGKEFETRLREKKPGDLSDELRTALGMPVGPGSHKIPPPWLIAQQRYGPPPSYPGLRIPGLNAPLPPSCCFGYHAGGWGKPPVDEIGRPLYGDVFGHNANNAEDLAEEAEAAELRANLWGELEADDSEASSSEGEEEGEGGESGDEEGAVDAAGLATPSGGAAGLATPSGMASIPLGMETPDTIQLRKRKVDADMEEGGEDTPQPQLYHVLPERRVGITSGMMASTHVYDVPRRAAAPPAAPPAAPEAGSVELALDPSELELDADQMAARYERQVREQRGEAHHEDLSDMLAEHVARQKTKRKRQQQQGENKQSKKYKEFKF